jgi:hypothetical protein
MSDVLGYIDIDNAKIFTDGPIDILNDTIALEAGKYRSSFGSFQK